MATTKSVGFAVETPPIAASPYGLINEVTLQKDDVRWEGGVAYESLACAAVVELWDICGGDGTIVSDGTGNDRGVYAPSFGITAIDTCTSTFGSDSRDRAEERVLQLLEASTPKAVERELKWGHIASTATPQGRWLTSPDTVVVDSSGVAPDVAVSLLEDAYAACSYGGGGVLHMSPGALAGYEGKSVKDERPDILYTYTGTMVISGAGYAPTGQEAAPWDGNWMFITGPVQVWLGEPQMYPESLDKAVTIATNDIRFKAERLAAVTFDGCCTFAVKVDLTKI